MVLRLFIFAAAYGRYILVAGLIAGFGFPGAAAILKNFPSSNGCSFVIFHRISDRTSKGNI